MSNAIYPIYKHKLLTAAANVSLDQNTAQDGPYALLIDTGVYTYNPAHDFKDDITGIVGASDGVRIASPTVNSAGATAGTFDGADVTFTAVTGATVEGFIIYRHNAGAASTWVLVMYYDAAGGGLPVTPNGGDISIVWNSSGIFQL